MLFTCSLCFGSAKHLAVKCQIRFGAAMKLSMPLLTVAALGLLAEAAQPQMGSMSLASVADALANMADQVPANSSTVQSIKDYVAQMMADITSQHNTAQAELTDISGYTSCDTIMSTSFSTLATTTPAAATTTLGALAVATTTTTTLHASALALQQCLSEVEAINASLTTCASEHTAAQAASDAVCMNFHYKTVVDAKAERCNETFSGSYEQYLERDVQILADYVSKKQNCSNFTAVTDSKGYECESVQAKLFEKQLQCSNIVIVTTTAGASTTAGTVEAAAAEEAACTLYHKQVEICSDYDSCYESVTLAKDADKVSASTLEESRQAEWLSLQRMSCLVGVLGSDVATGIQDCMNKPVTDYSTTHLKLVLPNAPTKHACGPFQKPATCSEVEPEVPEVLNTVTSRTAKRSFR